jgi:serpin B
MNKVSMRGRRVLYGCVAALTALLTAAGCAAQDTDPTLVRVAAPASRPVVSDADRQAAATGTTAFGVDLYHSLAGGAAAGNLVISPSSMANALGMLLPGARGRTATEISSVLHSALPPDRFTAALGALGRDEQAQADADKTHLRESDAVWTQKGFGLRRSYLETLAASFDTGVHAVDFRSDPEGSRKTVNDLVRRQTDGEIKDLFPTEAITPDTRLLLTDTVTFKAKWQHAFDPGATANGPFHRLDGSTATTPMMGHQGSYGYAQGPGWQAAELPYNGGHLAMDVLLPVSGGFPGFAKSLTAARLSQILGHLRDTELDLSLPRFTFDSQESLNQTLAQLGMATAFGGGADFGGIPADGGQRLAVRSVVQKAHIAVDENGTTAAAGSGIAMGAGAAAPPRSTDFHADRPFLFLIRDLRSGQTLFLGQVTDPAS